VQSSLYFISPTDTWHQEVVERKVWWSRIPTQSGCHLHSSKRTSDNAPAQFGGGCWWLVPWQSVCWPLHIAWPSSTCHYFTGLPHTYQVLCPQTHSLVTHCSIFIKLAPLLVVLSTPGLSPVMFLCLPVLKAIRRNRSHMLTSTTYNLTTMFLSSCIVDLYLCRLPSH